MPKSGWKQLLAGFPWFDAEGAYPIAAYSEFLPPPRLGRKPYGWIDRNLVSDDPNAWNVSEYEEAFELKPGLEHLAQQLVGALIRLGRGETAHGIARGKLVNNPYWPLEENLIAPPHERFVTLLPLALSRTQDDKGRLRWTLFGASEQGPAQGFWKSFYTAPGEEIPAKQAFRIFASLLQQVYGEPANVAERLDDAGFRILPLQGEPLQPHWREELPSWVEPLRWNASESLEAVKYLLTFTPYGRLPESVRHAYQSGNLNLLPFPGSMVFWGVEGLLKLARDWPCAVQAALLQLLARHEGPTGLRVPQAGWLHEARDDEAAPHHHGPVRNTFRRTHRWAKVHRDQDELAIEAREDKLLHVLFSTSPDDLGLYGKPMARNVQLWTHDFEFLLDGPRASTTEICAAQHAVVKGGLFGYRFQYPPMRVGLYDIYWHRPLVAFLPANTAKPALVDPAPLGYVTAYHADRPKLDRPVELWPHLLQRPTHSEAVVLFDHAHDATPHETARNVRKIVDAHDCLAGLPVPRSLARQLIAGPKQQSAEDWLESLPRRASDMDGGKRLAAEIEALLAPQTGDQLAGTGKSPASLTLAYTARRAFEVAYWKMIARLSEGKYLNKDNADCIRDTITQEVLTNPHRDLDAFGDYILDYYRRVVAAAGMSRKALVGELPFTWRTDFDFSWSGGWQANQEGTLQERDLVVVIPGRDRSRAVIMADHYDTAYMLDRYDKQYGGIGARLAACGADDNHSATAALMLGANAFLGLSKTRKLDCDIWLVHLTGEEFPSDCLGARHLCQRLVEGDLQIRLSNGKMHDLSKVRVQGVYVLDMVAHNNDRDRDVFQISPGTGCESFWLAYQAHQANELWNAGTAIWNERGARREAGRGRRSPHGGAIPRLAKHPRLSGEVRLPYAPRSTLYNTDGQIFSDAGVPVVLFMENYDIDRTGYHDTHDTMANIDLDYGAAVAAIAIESVARAATEKPNTYS